MLALNKTKLVCTIGPAAEQVVYIDDQPLFIQVAEGLGIRGIRHTDYQSTCEALASFGVQTDEGGIHETR